MRAHRIAVVPVALLLVALLLVSLTGGATAGAASDATLTRIFAQCQRGAVSSTYTQADYQDALTRLPTDLAEYTNCPAVIRTAQVKAAARATDLRVACRLVDHRTDLRCTVTQLRTSSSEPHRLLRATIHRQGRTSAKATHRSRSHVTVTLRGSRRISTHARAVVDIHVFGQGEEHRVVLGATSTRTFR